MKHPQQFIDWYDDTYGEKTVNEFDRFIGRVYSIPAYKSHMSMMPSVVERRYQAWREARLEEFVEEWVTDSDDV